MDGKQIHEMKDISLRTFNGETSEITKTIIIIRHHYSLQ